MSRLAALIVTFALCSPGYAFAQSSVFMGGGATFPVGGIGSRGAFAGANTGWQATAGVQLGIGRSGLSLGPRVYYGSNGHETPGYGSNLFGGAALLNFRFGGPLSVSPFLWGELGVLSHGFESESDAGSDVRSTAAVAAGGAGVDVPLGGFSAFVAAGYNSHLGGDFDLTYLALYAGLGIPLGGM